MPMFYSPCLQDKGKWEKYIRSKGFLDEDAYADTPYEDRPTQETYEVKIKGHFERTFELREYGEAEALHEAIGEIDEFIEGTCNQNSMKVWID